MAAHSPSTVAAILVAAGAGQRLGAELPKAFVRIGARTLLERAVAVFSGHPGIGPVIVVAPRSHVGEAGELTGRAVVVAGGETRQASVAAGLAALPVEVDFVLVHDVARAFVPTSVIDAVLQALAGGADAVVPVLPITDTVRRVEQGGMLAGVVDRSTLVAVQTPQGFRRDVLVGAHERAAGTATDDAGLVEALGHRVVAVPGSDAAFKITTAADLARAEFLASQPSILGGTP